MKKWMCVVVVFLLASALYQPPIKATSAFSDVSPKYLFYDEIMYLSQEKIINGYGDNSFAPGETVTRAAAAAMIGRALGLDGTQRPSGFKDVSKESFASGYIESAVTEGIIQGFTDGTFKPNQTVTRGQMALFIYRAFQLVPGAQNTYKDVIVGTVAYNAISMVSTNGITMGYNDHTFRPYDGITRGQFSAFLARTLDPSFVSEVPSEANYVNFLNVGNGDSILIRHPNGKYMLIDAGSKGEDMVRELKDLRVTKIDTFVATHPDPDHIGGADTVIRNYGVEHVIDSGQPGDTEEYAAYLKAIEDMSVSHRKAKVGENISLDPDVQSKVLWVDQQAENIDNGSIVLKLDFSGISYLLMGDAGKPVEDQLLSSFNLKSDVLKVSTTDMKDASSAAFLKEVNPRESVLSYDESNPNGFPSDEVRARIGEYSDEVLTTPFGDTVRTFVDREGTLFVGNEESDNDVIKITEPYVNTSDDVKITVKNLQNEMIALTNKGDTAVNLGGWKIVSVNGNQVYTFPQEFILYSRASVYVTSGPNAIDNPSFYMKWTNANIWNNEGDAAELYDSSGKLIHRLP